MSRIASFRLAQNNPVDEGKDNMFVPYHADVVMERMPIANWVIIGLTILVSLWGFQAPSRLEEESGLRIQDLENLDPATRKKLEDLGVQFGLPDPEPTAFDRMLLDGWSVTGLFGYMFLHNGIFHLLGNMLFLFVFGNAVCAKIGNLWYPLVYFVAGLMAGVAHLLFSSGPALGASGAVNGIVGIFLVYYPINNIRCAWIYFLYGGALEVSSYWLILIWFVFDVLGAYFAADGVAYAAHIGGFLFGFALGSFLLLKGIRPSTRYERSFYDVLGGRAAGMTE